MGRDSKLTGKIFLRLVLLVVLYLSYLGALHFLTTPSSPLWLPFSSFSSSSSSSPLNLITPSKQQHERKYSKTICTNNSRVDVLIQDFMELQTRQLEYLNTSNNSNGRFIVYSAIGVTGLGNRIPPLVSSFLLALLTKRGFLVHWPHVNESINDENEHIGMVAFHQLFQAPFMFDGGMVPEFYDHINSDNTAVVSLEAIADVLLCGDIEEEYGSVSFLVIYGWRPFFDLLFQNSRYMHKIKELGLQDLVHAIAQCLLQPIPEVHQIIQEVKEERGIGPHTQLVGIHIRKLSSHGLTNEQERTLWECVREKHPPPPHQTFSADYSNKNASLLYFLASDDSTSFMRAPADLQPYIVTIRGEMERHNGEGLARALADIWFLGESIELYGAHGTTFLAAVRTLFNTSTHLLTYGPHSSSSSPSTSTSPSLSRCTHVGPLPCFKWWDVFRTQKNFSLSCFIQHAPRKPNYIC